MNFWPLFTARKCKSVWASGGFAPWTPTRALPWTRWGAYSAPQTPSCVQQWPTVIASCACGATPDPVSRNNWVITKYASQFFKAGYGPDLLGFYCTTSRVHKIMLLALILILNFSSLLSKKMQLAWCFSLRLNTRLEMHFNKREPKHSLSRPIYAYLNSNVHIKIITSISRKFLLTI